VWVVDPCASTYADHFGSTLQGIVGLDTKHQSTNVSDTWGKTNDENSKNN
jgi:hypothetical protein